MQCRIYIYNIICIIDIECGEIPDLALRVYAACAPRSLPIGVILCWSRLGQMLSMELLIEYITRLQSVGWIQVPKKFQIDLLSMV